MAQIIELNVTKIIELIVPKLLIQTWSKILN
jgi:hypothetical protein